MTAVDMNDTSSTFFGVGTLAPRAMLESADGRSFPGDDGLTWNVELAPGLDDEEMAQHEALLAWKVPPEIRDLLRLCAGFTVGWWELDFRPKLCFDYREFFPMAVKLCSNDSGDSWMVDIDPDTGAWGGVFFVSTEPPVLIVQSTSLAGFLSDLFAQLTDPHLKPIDAIEHQRPADIFMKNPGLIHESALDGQQYTALRELVGKLPPGHEAWVADLRSLQSGTGVTWHRKEPGMHVKRVSKQPVFLVTKPRPKPKKGLLGRLFSRG